MMHELLRNNMMILDEVLELPALLEKESSYSLIPVTHE
jgi:hypothetical protein